MPFSSSCFSLSCFLGNNIKTDHWEISDVEAKSVAVQAGIKHAPGWLRDGLFLVQHLVLCPEEVLAVIVDGLELEIQTVYWVLKIRNSDRVS